MIQRNHPLKCFLFDKDPLDCTLSLIHKNIMNFNTGKVNVVSAVSRIQANLIEWGALFWEMGTRKKFHQQNR